METQGDEETGLSFCNETGFALGPEFRANCCLALKLHEPVGLGQQAVVKLRALEVLAIPSPPGPYSAP